MFPRSSISRSVNSRSVGWLVVVLFSVLLFQSSVCLQAQQWQTTEPTPEQIYVDLCNKVYECQYHFDTAPTPIEWASRVAKYKSQVKSKEDAVKYANLVIATLHVKYTQAFDQATEKAWRAWEDDSFEGFGFSFKVVKENGGCIKILATEANGPARAAGLRKGDYIVSVDGKSTQKMDVASFQASVGGAVGTQKTLGIKRDNQEWSVTLTRTRFTTQAVVWSWLSGNVGYIRIEKFTSSSVVGDTQSALLQLNNAKAYIIDLRGNGGGLIDEAIDCASMFLDSGPLATLLWRIPADGYQYNEIVLYANSKVTNYYDGNHAYQSQNVSGRYSNLTGNKPVVILVDKNTASAAEIFTMALRENKRVTVIGGKTWGKGVGQNDYYVHGIRIHITTIKLLTPNGNWLGFGSDNGISSESGPSPDQFARLGKSEERGTTDSVVHHAQEHLTKALSHS